jgi:hypothetical protein
MDAQRSAWRNGRTANERMANRCTVINCTECAANERKANRCTVVNCTDCAAIERLGSGATDAQATTEREAQWQPNTGDNNNTWPGGPVAQTHTYRRHYSRTVGPEDAEMQSQFNAHRTMTWAAVNGPRDTRMPPYYDDHSAVTDAAAGAAQPQLYAHRTAAWAAVDRPTDAGMPRYHGDHSTVTDAATRDMKPKVNAHRAATGDAPVGATANRGIASRPTPNRAPENQPMVNLNMTHSAIAKRARADRAAVIRPTANTVPANIATEAALQLYAKFQIRDDIAPPTNPHAAPNCAPPVNPRAAPNYTAPRQAATNIAPPHHRPAVTENVPPHHPQMQGMNGLCELYSHLTSSKLISVS